MSFPTPWGAYIAGHPNNTTTSLYDFTGNGRNATITGTAPVFTQGSGNGATASIPFITGTTSTIITWPANSIPTPSFTILSMTRYTTSPFQRILQASTLDFIIGHWMGYVGLEYHQKQMTQFSANSPNVSSATNWLVMCGTTGGTTPNNILVNGVGNGTSTGGFTGAQLTINTGFANAQTSNFAFQQVLIWNTVLTETQMQSISNTVMSYLTTGGIVYPWSGNPSFGNTTSSDPSSKSICGYYFDDIVSNNVKNGTTYQYDLSLVNVGTATPTISKVLNTINAVSNVPTLYQNTGSSTSYSYYVNNTNTAIRSLTGSFSVSFWCYINSTFTATNGVVWCLYNDNSSNLITFTQASNSGAFIISITLNGVRFYIGNAVAYTTNAYHHFVLTCSTSGTTSTIQLYIDGSLINFGGGNRSGNTANVSCTLDTPTITASALLFNGLNTTLYVLGGQSGLGITWPAASTSVSNGFNGYLSQLTIYNAALTSAEVTFLRSNIYVTTPPYIPLVYPCFLEGTKILRMNPETDEEEYIAVEKLRRGDLIKTLLNGYKAIHSIGHKILPNPATDKDKRNRLYRFSKQKCPDVNRDLYITGEHCTLRLDLTYDQVEQIKDHMGRYYITDKHFRCPACLDERAEPYDREDKPVTIWHFALEHYDAYLNYGIYANGLLVESCSIEYLMKKSNMELI
jgi:hypothetical protein